MRFRRFLVWARNQIFSIRVRLTVWYVALLAGILAVFSAFLYLSLSQYLYSNVTSQLQVNVQDARRMWLRTGNISLSDLQPGADYVAVYTPLGQQIATSGPIAQPDIRKFVQANYTSAQPVRITLANDTDWMVYTTPVFLSNGEMIALVQVGQSLERTQDTLQRLLVQIAIALPITLILASSGGLFLASRALSPIDRIRRIASRISAQDLSQRIRLGQTHDEVGRLAATFDSMIERLDNSFRAQRQFTSDASHELRTPLALIRTETDIVLARERAPDEYRQALENIRNDVDRMSALVSDMLTLARADSGREQITKEPLLLGDIAREVLNQLMPFAESKNVSLVWSGDDPGPLVLGDETRLTQLVINLVDNGIKYAPGGAVVVSVREVASSAVLTVKDNGIGIPAEHLDKLFERFYRVDSSRTGGTSTGLGLAICEWITKVHGGTIEVESEEGMGAEFIVRLPLAK